MSIHVAIEHRTAYRFDRPTEIGPHVVRLRPAPHSRTGILSYSLTITPDDHFLNWQQDAFGNYLARVIFEEPADELSITVDLIADMTPFNPFDFFVEDSAQHFPFDYDAATARDLIPYLEVEECGPELLEWVDEVKVPEDGTPIVDFLVELNQRLNRDIAYTVRMAPGVQTPDETLRKRLGSCRDSGWLLVQILRRLGLASRFVSGYLVQLTADEPPLDGPPGPDADFTDLHAWCEVYIPGAGWIGLDPTSGLFASEGHIPLACTPHPSTAAPVEGATSKAEVEFEYANIVTRLHEDPRVTRPYSDDQWEAIDTLGRLVDSPTRRERRAPHPGRRADLRVRRRHGRRRVDDRGRRRGQARQGMGAHQAARRSGSPPPARCCTARRASGTRASRCPAGNSASTGAVTASRCGTGRTSWPIRGIPGSRASRRRRNWPWTSRSASASRKSAVFRATRTRWPICSPRRSFRSVGRWTPMSTRPIRACARR